MLAKNPVLVLSLSLFFLGCSAQKSHIAIINAKMTTAIDEKLMPVGITNTFPKGTTKIFCWFKWKNARVNSGLTAHWHFATDNIPILDYNFNIPRQEGMGSVSLAMPENKSLPKGQYKLDLIIDKHILRSLTFKVE